MIVNEIVNKIKFSGSLSPIKDLNSNLKDATTNIKDVGKGFLKIGAGITGVIGGIALFTNKTLESRQNLINLSSQIGVSTDKIQELGYIASQTGSSFDTIENSLSGLTDRISQALITGDEGFARLGVSIQKSNGDIKKSDELLLNIRDRFSDLKLSQEQKVMFANNLGLDRSLIDMLSMTNKQFDEILSKSTEFDIISKEDLDKAAEYNNTMRRLKTTFAGIATDLAIQFAPTFEKMANEFASWVRDNKEFIKDTGKNLGITLKYIASGLTGLVNGFSSVLKTANDFGYYLDSVLGSSIDDFVGGLTSIYDMFANILEVVSSVGNKIGSVFGYQDDNKEDRSKKRKEYFDNLPKGVTPENIQYFTTNEIEQMRMMQAPTPSIKNTNNRNTNSSTNTNNSTNNNISINVQGSNANDIAKKTMDTLKRYLDSTETQNKSVII